MAPLNFTVKWINYEFPMIARLKLSPYTIFITSLLATEFRTLIIEDSVKPSKNIKVKYACTMAKINRRICQISFIVQTVDIEK